MKCYKWMFLIIFTSIILSSCTTTRIASLINSPDDQVELYTTKLPDRNYIEIYYIQTDGAIFHSPRNLLNGLKKKAVKLKADAIINIKFDFQGCYPTVSGIAIKYTDK